MLLKLSKLVVKHKKQLFRYFITGVSAVVLDILSLIFLKEYLHIRPVVAVIINQILILNYVFFINKYWSFEENKSASHTQIIRFFVLQTGNYFFAVSCMWIFNEKMGFNYLLVRLACIILMTSWNFLFYRFWIYK